LWDANVTANTLISKTQIYKHFNQLLAIFDLLL